MNSINRWVPLFFYTANIITWLVIGILAREWDLLWLVVLPLFFVFLYILRIVKE
jgi:hypothetical protein